MTRTSRAPIVPLLLVLLGATLSTASVARAEPAISVVSLFGGGDYVPGTWVPLRVTLTNDTDRPIEGQIEATLPGIDGNLQLRADAAVPAKSRYRTTVYAPLATPERRPRDKSVASTIGIFTWTQSGAKIAQSDLLMRTSSEDGGGAESGQRTAVISINGAADIDAPSYDIYELRKSFGESMGVGPVTLWSVSASNVPVHPSGYEASRVVMLNGQAPDELSVPQREALLAFVRTGGTLVVLAPVGISDARGTWLEPHLPVQIVGQRLANRIAGADGKPLPLRDSVEISEATALDRSDVTVVLRDAHYVHAAHRRLGLGRIVFTSFPANAPTFDPKPDGEVTREFWAGLLGLTEPNPTWAGTRLPTQRKNVLQEMIGTPAPARGTAVAMAGAFALLVLVFQLIWRGPRRPIAFAASAIAAVVGAGVLGGIGWFAQRSDPLTAGRMSVLTLAPGGGLVQEVAAFTGDVRDVALSTGVPGATLQPIAYDASTPPILRGDTFASPDAGIAAGRIDRLWEGQAGAPSELIATATGTFDETGLRLSVDNRLPTPLAAPVLVRGGSVYRLAALPTGQTQSPLDPAARNVAPPTPTDNNPDALAAAASQKYLNSGPILTEVDKLRALVLSSVMHRPRTDATEVIPRTLIAGWAETDTPWSLIRTAAEPQVEQALRLVTFPLQVLPSAPGSKVRVDAGFNMPMPGKVAVPVYDASSGSWLSSSQPGQWQIGFRAPREIGRLALTRATVHLNVSLPVQSLVLRRGQVRDGKVDEDLARSGEEILRLGPTFGARPPVTVDLTPADFDAEGTFWIVMDVEAPADAGAVVPLWSITDFGADLEGTVVAEEGKTKIEDGG